MKIVWEGDLDDDCSAVWCGLLLRAEWMSGRRWWWAVTDLATEEEVESSNHERWCGLRFASGKSARQAAETAAENYLQRVR